MNRLSQAATLYAGFRRVYSCRAETAQPFCAVSTVAQGVEPWFVPCSSEEPKPRHDLCYKQGHEGRNAFVPFLEVVNRLSSAEVWLCLTFP